MNDAPEHGTEYGDTCNRDGCRGVMEPTPPDHSDGCSCHIAPPCGYCLDTRPVCSECGHDEGGAA